MNLLPLKVQVQNKVMPNLGGLLITKSQRSKLPKACSLLNLVAALPCSIETSLMCAHHWDYL